MISVKTQVRELILDRMCYVIVNEKVSGTIYCHVVGSVAPRKLSRLYINIKG